MNTGDSGTGPRRPRQVEAAWALTLAAVAAEALVWVLGVFVVAPTGLEELTEHSGRSGAMTQLALSAGMLVVFLGGWLAVAARMRAGRGWARAVLTVAGALFLAFRVGGLGMDGIDPAWWTALTALPELLAAAAVVPLYLPEARAHFPSRARRTV
ncbi:MULTISPECIES: hypothetical protein [Streptomyces]|uniref:hypothetical protein n=1 Tax=Streptomyces TaxID=1883 RepID=UPI0007567A58|nr:MULTISPECIES: hypothetical protein [unclassified Streptomyces]AQT76044.1 hypothetical protein B1K54_34580 [Streptomyces sp. fd1-xmd]MDX6761741.1 hypothetical protein [Streptomyces sp. F8]